MLFENVTISSQLMDRLYISKCHFKNVHFEPCQFDRMDLTDTVFENCELSHLKLMDGSIHRCEFKNCRLTGSDLSNCSIWHTTFLENTMQYANFSYSKFKFVRPRLMPDTKTERSFSQCWYRWNDTEDAGVSKNQAS